MKITIAVLFGGNSTEHEISVISAVQAMGYMDHEKYEILPVYMTKKSLFYTDSAMERIESFRDIPALLQKSRRVIFVREENRTCLMTYPPKLVGRPEMTPVDLAFPIVHGTNVEDGTLQGVLETAGLPVVGPGVLPSALGMDKAVMKSVFKDHGIPVLPCRVITMRDWQEPDAVIDALEQELPYPMIVKPVNLGSSIGISKAADRAALLEALELAFTFSGRVLVERAIVKLKEVNCAVLGDRDGAEASECEEPFASDEESILSFSDKYMSGGKTGGAKGGAKTAGGSKGMASLKRRIPADISEEMRERIRRTSVEAFHALEGAGVARIDFMIDEESGELFLNEINTIPGSLAFYLWEPLGLKYPAMLEKLISLALKSAREKEKLTTSFDTNILSTAKLGGTKGGAKG